MKPAGVLIAVAALLAGVAPLSTVQAAERPAKPTVKAEVFAVGDDGTRVVTKREFERNGKRPERTLAERKLDKKNARQSYEVNARKYTKDMAKGGDTSTTSPSGASTMAMSTSDATSSSSDGDMTGNYDYYTFDECRLVYRTGSKNPYLHKNHFASCGLFRMGIDYFECINNRCEITGRDIFRVGVLGRGVRGARNMQFQVELYDWMSTGRVLRNQPLRIDVQCLSYPNAECLNNPSGGVTKYITEWVANGRVDFLHDTSASPGEGIDGISYHDFRPLAEVVNNASLVLMPTGGYRCDTATYASGGGCIFDKVQATFSYSLTDPSVTAVAQHILQAQEAPWTTKPGGVGLVIPGSKASGVPLRRLYHDSARISLNRDTSKRVCDENWPGYATFEGLSQDCDEYPFARTYEGAALRSLEPNSIYSFSAKPLDRTQNRLAGGAYGRWLTEDHILDGDPFWMEIR